MLKNKIFVLSICLLLSTTILATINVEAEETNDEEKFTLHLEARWNLIGTPIENSLDELIVTNNETEYTFSEAVDSGIIYHGIYTIDPETGSYQFPTTLEPGKGYLVKCYKECDITFTGEKVNNLELQVNKGSSLLSWIHDVTIEAEDILNAIDGSEFVSILVDDHDEYGFPIYLTYDGKNPENNFDITQGMGFWVKTSKSSTWNGKLEEPDLTDKTHITTLLPEWNHISIPFNEQISLDDLSVVYKNKVLNWEEAKNQQVIRQNPLTYNRITGSLEEALELKPGYGYAIKSNKDNVGLYADETDYEESNSVITYAPKKSSIFFGIPSGESIKISDLVVVKGNAEYSYQEAVDENLINDTIYDYSREQQKYTPLTSNDKLLPGYGYFVRTFVDNVTLRMDYSPDKPSNPVPFENEVLYEISSDEADIDDNGVIEWDDFVLVHNHLGEEVNPPGSKPWDVDFDGLVTKSDLNLVAYQIYGMIRLYVDISDKDNDILNVSFYWENGTLIDTQYCLPSTEKAYVWAETQLDKKYSWYAVADDGIHTTTSDVFSFSMSEDIVSTKIPLYKGDNLITIPVETDMMASELVDMIPECVAIGFYDAKNQTYSTYVNDGSDAFDFKIKAGAGYCINVENDTLLALDGDPIEDLDVELFEGLNLLGWYEKESTTASEVMTNTPDCIQVCIWNGENQKYVYYNSSSDEDFIISQGIGYFVKIDSNTPPAKPCNPNPEDGETIYDVTSVDLSVEVFDSDDSKLDISFFWEDGTLIEKLEDVSSPGTAEITVSSLETNQDYSWYAVADDGETEIQSEVFSFYIKEQSSEPEIDVEVLESEDKIEMLVKNNGEAVASDVEWSISAEGTGLRGIISFQNIDLEKDGVIDLLSSGGKEKVSTDEGSINYRIGLVKLYAEAKVKDHNGDVLSEDSEDLLCLILRGQLYIIKSL